MDQSTTYIAITRRQRMAGQNGYMAGQHQFCSINDSVFSDSDVTAAKKCDQRVLYSVRRSAVPEDEYAVRR